MSGYPARKVITFSVLIAIIAIFVPFSISCSKPPAPVAAFSVSYVSGNLMISEEYIAGMPPLKIQFNDQSTGEITEWKWNFGDGIVVEGKDESSRNPVHEYITPNTGYIVTLTVRGPGGMDRREELSIVTVFRCSEAAVAELSQVGAAIEGCLNAAGVQSLDAPVAAWDGSRGVVMAGGIDAADHLGVWDHFKATYEIAQDGSIVSGTDMSWGCVLWSASGLIGRAGWVAKE
ncbi:MAG: PKD domain-containing protein [Dehalococcoidia bacterium]|nr:PKD domain-containing protein [Dehalococcoidia bacterium]